MLDKDSRTFIEGAYWDLYDVISEVTEIPNPVLIVLGYEQKAIIQAYTSLLRWDRGMRTPMSLLKEMGCPKFFGVPAEYGLSKDAIHVVYKPEDPGPSFMKSL